MKVTVFDSNKPGKNIVILAAVHGDELCGVKAMQHCCIAPLRGSVTFIAVNEKAIQQKKRFVEQDLNRSFFDVNQSLEGRLAKKLIYYLDKADVLLDIHSSYSTTSPVFCICEKHSLAFAKCLPGEIIATNFDAFHKGSTDWYMNQQQKIAVCLECGSHNDPRAVTVAKKAIQSTLCYFGVIEGLVKSKRKKIIQMQECYTANNYFTPVRSFADFARVNGIIGHENGPISRKGHIVFARNATKGEQAFMIGRVVGD